MHRSSLGATRPVDRLTHGFPSPLPPSCGWVAAIVYFRRTYAFHPRHILDPVLPLFLTGILNVHPGVSWCAAQKEKSLLDPFGVVHPRRRGIPANLPPFQAPPPLPPSTTSLPPPPLLGATGGVVSATIGRGGGGGKRRPTRGRGRPSWRQQRCGHPGHRARKGQQRGNLSPWRGSFSRVH